jgi:glycine betaine catabolism B
MHRVKILLTEFVTHNVKRIITDKPKGYKFTPGQATEVTVNSKKWEKERRPFTFTSLNDDLVLEFTIKDYPKVKYPNHDGMTEAIHKLVPGDELLIDDPWGTIKYKGTGVFIAGGAGLTPFIAILKQLAKTKKLTGNKLIFSNKTVRDIIIENQLRGMFENSDDLILTLTREKKTGFEYGRVDKKFLKQHVENFNQHFYVCGPGKMVVGVREILSELGAKTDTIVFEE